MFRFDENISFVKHELLPKIEQMRDRVAEKWAGSWRRNFRITVSFADGASARISAIQHSLRPYRPTFMHMWQLKTFWHDAKVCEDDVEILPFEDVAMLPAVPAKQAEHGVRLVVDEMARLRRQFMDIVQNKVETDLVSFWHRKTRKLVIAVLLVQKKDGPMKLYHGTNMEVSMPTGSLCAERNVIGSALADDLTLRRTDLRMVAVLGLNLEDDRATAVPETECESGDESVEQSVDVETHCVIMPAWHSTTVGPASPKVRSTRETEALESPCSPAIDRTSSEPATAPLPLKVPGSPARNKMFRSYHRIASNVDRATPASTTRTVAVEDRDMNPLAPCGACSEWLKKIAEVNPGFRVVTFTDTELNGIFTETCVDVA